MATVLKRSRNLFCKDRHLNVVITGGSRGLGKGLASTFLENGHRVVTISRTEVPTHSTEHHHIQATIGSDLDETKTAFTKTCDHYDGHIDIWINNAALNGKYGAFVDLSEEQVHQIIGVNAVGVVLLTKMVQSVMKHQSTGGDIYNIVGAGSDGRATPMFTTYGAGKAIVKQFTKSLQHEWYNSRVGLHLISPGMMDTALLYDGMPDHIRSKIQMFVSNPDEVAADVFDEIIDVYYQAKPNQHINYMNLNRIMNMILSQIITRKKTE
jgi:chlorophyll(ide) b reductase